MFKEYNGHNARELAWKYGLTENWLRTILRENGFTRRK
ncbi:Mor transcription activator family protein [Paenibacillus validus]